MKTHSLHLFVVLACLLLPAVLPAADGAKTFDNGYTGNVTTTATTNNNSGYNKIKLETSNDDTVRVETVEVYNRWTHDWDDITIQCPIPAGSEDDPVITLPEDAQNGDRFRVRVTVSDGTDAGNKVTVTPSVTK